MLNSLHLRIVWLCPHFASPYVAVQRLISPASGFPIFCTLFVQLCVRNGFLFLKGLEGKVFELHGWAKRGIVLHRVGALLSLEVSCGISAPAPAILHLLQQQTISNPMSQPATW